MLRRHLVSLLLTALVACVGAAPVGAQGTFTRTGDCAVGRNLCSAILLNDGRVLVAGGTRTVNGGSQYNREAEIYDPAAGTFSATGSLTVARAFHAAVGLKDGRVLFVGGQQDNGTFLASAEVFDPVAGSFKAAGSMIGRRARPSASLLKDGRVLVVGGFFIQGEDVGFFNVGEIYDPATNAFTPTERLQAPRLDHEAVALPDGRVLIIGGWGETSLGPDPVLFKQVEAFDPATGTFTTVGELSEGRRNPSVTLLSDGKVLIAGGWDFSTPPNSINTVEVFDPASGTSSAPTAMSEGRINHVAVALSDGRVLLAGGSTGPNRDHSTAWADLFDPTSGKTTPIASMTEARSQTGAVLLPDGRVLIVGGARFQGGSVTARLQTAEIYQP